MVSKGREYCEFGQGKKRKERKERGKKKNSIGKTETSGVICLGKEEKE